MSMPLCYFFPIGEGALVALLDLVEAFVVARSLAARSGLGVGKNEEHDDVEASGTLVRGCQNDIFRLYTGQPQ
jgi:hypothetical protein